MSSKQKTLRDAALPDLRAGLVVFLIALPLSLGISLASGAPPTAGLLSAILGGLIGAFLGGSFVTINGPAAGLIVVVLSAIESLGQGDPILGFKRTLACVVVVGVLQVISGVLKSGRLAVLFPISVVYGMLAAIGLIIMIKQFHVFLGKTSDGTIMDNLMEIPHTLLNIRYHSALIGLSGLGVLLSYPYLKSKFSKLIPAPLVVVILGIIMTRFLPEVRFVEIPSNIAGFFIFPVFDMVTSKESLLAIISIFFVASLESILSAMAIDQLDPEKRESDFDRELWSKGAVNIACGFLGGLPVIAEIVRSSASINQGGKTPLANFSHAIFLLFFIVLYPTIINKIPLSALASILLVVGYRLAQPRQFKEMLSFGLSSFLSFVTTILVTLIVDLLVGILAGMVVKTLSSFLQGARFKYFFHPSYQVHKTSEKITLEFEGSLIFFSGMRLKSILKKECSSKNMVLDLRQLTYLDPTTLSLLFRESIRFEKNGDKLNILVPQKFEKTFSKIKSTY